MSKATIRSLWMRLLNLVLRSLLSGGYMNGYVSFELTNPPPAFQHFMNDCLVGLGDLV